MKEPELFDSLFLKVTFKDKEDLKITEKAIQENIENIFKRSELGEDFSNEAKSRIASFFKDIVGAYFLVLVLGFGLGYFSITQLWLYKNANHLQNFQNFIQWILIKNYKIYSWGGGITKEKKSAYFIQSTKNINAEVAVFQQPPKIMTFISKLWEIPLTLLMMLGVILIGLVVVSIPILILYFFAKL